MCMDRDCRGNGPGGILVIRRDTAAFCVISSPNTSNEGIQSLQLSARTSCKKIREDMQGCYAFALNGGGLTMLSESCTAGSCNKISQVHWRSMSNDLRSDRLRLGSW
jgi:hypothetical protein